MMYVFFFFLTECIFWSRRLSRIEDVLQLSQIGYIFNCIKLVLILVILLLLGTYYLSFFNFPNSFFLGGKNLPKNGRKTSKLQFL